MPSEAVRERLAHDVGLWLVDGLVSKDTHDLLRRRYGAKTFGIVKAVKSLGIAGGIVAFFGLLGLIGAASGSGAAVAALLVLAGAALTVAGIQLSIDRLGRYPASSKVLLLLGVITAALGIGMAMSAVGMTTENVAFFTGILVVGPVFVLAYRFRNSFLLYVALIGLFHWVGSWTSMSGRSTYDFSIADQRLMSVVALAAIVFGISQEQAVRAPTGRFVQAYEVMGLVYLNLSLLILTIDPPSGQSGLWIVIWFAAALLQIVTGAARHAPLFTGFGVTCFALNAYTRYFEYSWNDMHKGVFFLLGGAALFGAGAMCEVVLKRGQRSEA